MAHENIHVFVNRQKVDLETVHLSVADLLRKAGFDGQGWDVLRLQGEGDPTGGTLLVATETLDVKNGDRFRVIPGNRTFGGCDYAGSR